MKGFNKVVRRLQKLENNRPDPSDHLINIVEATRGIKLTDEEEANFYNYITCQDKDDFEYLPRSEIVTLEDLGEDEIKKIHDELYSDYDMKCVKNGMDIILTTNKKDKNGESLVGACKEVQIDSCRQKDESQISIESSCENVSSRECGSPEEKKEES